MKHETGLWQVTRNCCRSGMCFRCQGAPTRPLRIVQGDRYSEAYAKHVARNWSECASAYAATAERMLVSKFKVIS